MLPGNKNSCNLEKVSLERLLRDAWLTRYRATLLTRFAISWSRAG